MGADSRSRKYIVVTTQRSGSGWLLERINNVPGAQGNMELFYPEPRRAPPKAGCNDFKRYVETGDRFRNGRRPASVFAYLDALYERPGTVGFKLMYDQLARYPEVLAYAAMRRVSLVHLVRRNHFDIVVSMKLAGMTGSFHSTAADGPRERSAFVLDPADVSARVRRLARKQQLMRMLLRAVPTRVHEVGYEELCAGNEAFIELCRFLEIPGEQEDRSQSRLVKIQRSPHREIIRNYQEVRSALESAGFQHLLH